MKSKREKSSDTKNWDEKKLPGSMKYLDGYPTLWDIVNKQPPPWILLEFPEFSEWCQSYFPREEDYADFQAALSHLVRDVKQTVLKGLPRRERQ